MQYCENKVRISIKKKFYDKNHTFQKECLIFTWIKSRLLILLFYCHDSQILSNETATKSQYITDIFVTVKSSSCNIITFLNTQIHFRVNF